MNREQFKNLLAVNLRLLNPQVTDRLRRKGKIGAELTNKLKMQFLLNGLIFFLVYGTVMLPINLAEYPNMFTYYVVLFVLLAISQSISGIYSVFFAGKDLNNYLPLPFKQKEIFLSKVTVVALNVIPFIFPLFIAFFSTAWHAGIMIPIALLLSLIVFCIILTIILFACAIIVFALTKTSIFRKHQKMVMNGLMVITLVIAMAGILLVNNSDYMAGKHQAISPIMLPLFKTFVEPTSIISLLNWIGLIIVLLILGFVLKHSILPHLSSQLTSINSQMLSNSGKRKHVDRKNLNAILDAYNRQVLKESNILLQVLVNSVALPLIFIISFAFTQIPSDLPLKWVGVFFVGGLAFSAFITNSTTVVANMISLDRGSLEFVNSLPISMKQYLKRKFILGYIFQIVINLALIIVMIIVWKLNLYLSLSMILSTIWGTYLISLYYFSQDYRLRITNWTNVTELFNRGGGNMAIVLKMLIVMILSVGIIILYSFLIGTGKPAIIVNGIVAFLIIVLSFIVVEHYRQKFWQKFE
ncbi:hypothetical protein CPEBRM1_ABPJDJAI_01241 [Companilactobacillus paralimentarius]|uniref:ABC transporter permease n=1 Tax=Companilactobacillus paralimentarius TaxID=83526 RepID=UPI00384EED8F